MKLSIAVITMNRARQLSEALISCFACELPQDTQFVIIDNASTDNTNVMVRELFEQSSYNYYYERLPENLGVGGGRNYAFSKANGEYVYFLDDDAYIDLSVDNLFFIKAIEILDSHPEVMSLTTQIYDNLWQRNRNSESPSIIIEPGLYECFMMCGGSHYLRRSFFPNNAPFFANKYAYEEFLPSLRIADAGKLNAYCPDLRIIHNPAVNKWHTPEMDVLSTATHYAIKSLCYPVLVQPILRLAFWKRRKLCLTTRDLNNKTKRLATEIKRTFSVGHRIKISTTIQLFQKFGMTIW